jgi:hypothetical protein
MNKNFTQEDINKAVKDALDISAENFIILGINSDGIEIASLLSEERLVSYILDSLVGLILKRANRYEEKLEQTLFFTKRSILSELERRIIKNFKN